MREEGFGRDNICQRAALNPEHDSPFKTSVGAGCTNELRKQTFYPSSGARWVSMTSNLPSRSASKSISVAPEATEDIGTPNAFSTS